MIYHLGILNLTLSPDPKEPLADPGLIPLDKFNIVALFSCDNGGFVPEPTFIVASTMDPISGPPAAPSLSQQLGSIHQQLPVRHGRLPPILILSVTVLPPG